MWRLTPLQWNDSVWRLPLCSATAGRMAEALLDPASECQRGLAELLQSDPALLLWVLCQAPDWRSAPPQDPTAPAEWLQRTAILGGILELESDANDAPDHDLPPGDHFATRPWPQSLLSEARALLSRHGSQANTKTLLGCPWFPQWLLPDTSIPDEQHPTCTAERCSAGTYASTTLSRLLPRVLQLVRRANALETQFASELEREKLAALRELAYGASHEINNPLANIATRAQSLLRDEPDLERKRKLSTIAAQAYRAHEMISDMMLFAKPPAPAFQATDVAAVVRDVIREMLPDAELQATELGSTSIPESLLVSADPTQIGVAIKALVRNSLEALATGGVVEVTLGETGPDATGRSWVEIVVRDTGPGITSEVRRHLFDPFYSGREAGRGLGFGLAKCWRIAELHRGAVTVDSQPGRGATFTLRLPARPVQ